MSVLATVSVVDALAQRLREQVLDGVIPAGAPVAETEVASAFGVSRPTAKSAILTLVHGGLLRRDAYRPAYVPLLTPEDVYDLYRARILLELEVVRALASARTVPAAAEDAVQELQRLPEDVATSHFIATDLRFHRALVEAARSPRLSRLYEMILDEIQLTTRQSRRALGRDRIGREHAEVLENIRAGKTARATETMRTHLECAARALADMLITGDDSPEANEDTPRP
jgi:DNA-binding GntR family transcriptional regulator